MESWHGTIPLLVQAFVIVGGFVVFGNLIAERMRLEIQSENKDAIHRIEVAIETGKKDHEAFRAEMKALRASDAKQNERIDKLMERLLS